MLKGNVWLTKDSALVRSLSPDSGTTDLISISRYLRPSSLIEQLNDDTTSEIMGLSGLQREVLSLYRKCLREVRKKPTVGIPFVQ